ncbi:MAG: hypothetical protein KF866_03090 [Phycisphaeraceae bacterium]|nr:hypothetical protein [Phycisphaeraceae bacterium]MCW5753318.1 hypothetical protein [Phycisphaeraceae bacterium]
MHKSTWILGMVLAASCARAETFTVDLIGVRFEYQGMVNRDIVLVINPGDTVQWNWVSGFHNVVSGQPDDPDIGALFDSGSPTTEPGINFAYTFTTPGIYWYLCEPHIHHDMVSSIVVTPAPAGGAILAIGGLLAFRRRRSP